MSQQGTFCNLWKLLGPEVTFPYATSIVLLIILACSIAIVSTELILSQKIDLGLGSVFCRKKKVKVVNNTRSRPTRKIIIIRSRNHQQGVESRTRNVSSESRPNSNGTAFVRMSACEIEIEPPRRRIKEPSDLDIMNSVFEEMILESRKDILKRTLVLIKSNKILIFVMLSLMLSVTIHLGAVLIDGVLRARDYANLYHALKSAKHYYAANTTFESNPTFTEDITNSP